MFSRMAVLFPSSIIPTDEDDLEYHVTFPSPTPRMASGAEHGDDFVFVKMEEKEPVVLLLGWAGCIDKNLAKYSALYELKGCITIRYTPTHDLMFKSGKLQRVASKLLELLSDLNLEDHPVLFHVMSNGGCMVYRHICEIKNRDASKKIDVQGCIFDSGPATLSLMGMTYATVVAFKGNKLYRMAAGVITFLYFAFRGLVEMVASFAWKEPREMFFYELWDRLVKEQSMHPQLFLFSKADDICGYKSILRFQEHRRQRGVYVQSICWNDSPHVGHLRFHTEAYTQKVYDFLDMCLSDKDS